MSEQRVLKLIKKLSGIDDVDNATKTKIQEMMINNYNVSNLHLLSIAAQFADNIKKTQPIQIKDYLLEEVKKTDSDIPETKKSTTINTFVNVMNMLNNKSMLDTLKMFNPSSLYKKMYIPLDSRNSASTDINNVSMTWYITTSQHIQVGSINIPTNLRDIVSIRVMQCFFYSTFPYILNREQGNLFYVDHSQHRLALNILELNSQAFSSPSGLKWHFLSQYDLINLNPIYQPGITTIYRDNFINSTRDLQYNYGNFIFNKPITIKDTISVILHDLHHKIPLYDHVINLSVVHYFTFAFGGIEITYIIVNFTIIDYPFAQIDSNDIYGVTLPDISTTNPSADAAWITTARATLFRMKYRYYYSNQLTVTPLTVLSKPVGTIIVNTVRFSVTTKFYAELEVTYIDSNI